MATDKQFDETISQWLEQAAHARLPERVLNATFERTRRSRQQVAWRALLRRPQVPRFTALLGSATAVLIVALVALGLFVNRPGFGDHPSPTPAASPTAEPSPPVTAAPAPSVAAGLPEGPYLLSEGPDGGVAITVTIAAPLWQPGLCWGDPDDTCAAPPDGAGLIAFEGGEYYVYGDACHYLTTKPDTPATTVDELVDALANQGSREASAPEDITVDGYAGKKVILHRAGEVDITTCDEGGDSLTLFGVPGDDRARYSQGPGQIEEVWAVDVDGLLVVLNGLYYLDTMPSVVNELHAVMASATFDVP